MPKLAVFDFDSTLMDGETINFFANEMGVGGKVSEITQRAMSGELDFFESLTSRVALLQGLKVSKVNDICRNLPLIKGAKETIKGLKNREYIVVCFSGGFRNATEPTCEKLGIDADFANFLHHKDGALTGSVGGEMMETNSKGAMIQRIQNLLGVTPSETIAIGDGANDISMFNYAETKIAFCAHDILKKAATHCIDNKNLIELLSIVD